MLLSDLFLNAGIDLPEEYDTLSNIEISGVVTDSRRAFRGCIFVCIAGHNNDGHDYIKEAIKNGALVIVAEQVRDGCVGGAAIIKVDNTRLVAARLYNEWYKRPSDRLKIVGITGTNGKTSVSYMLESIFLEAGVPCAVIGTLGCRINGIETQLCRTGLTTPDSSELYPFLARLADEGIAYVFMEVSSHSLALSRVEGIEFEYGVFTNLTRDHLDFHGDMESYFEAKARLFEHCRGKIINTDDPWGARLLKRYEDGVSCSRRSGASVATSPIIDADGIKYTLCFKGENYRITSPALGDFALTNSQLAATLAFDAGLSAKDVIGGLSRFEGVEGRMEKIRTERGFDVVIDYAHTPDALERLLLSLHSIYSLRGGGARIILVFGCGGERDRGKRKQMASVASRLCDFVIVTSDNPRGEDPDAIIADVMKGIDKEKPHVKIKSREDAINYAVEIAREGDVVVFAGKGHKKYQITAEGRIPFDEREVLRSALKKIKREGNV